MKSKERSWVLTKEGPIHKVKKDYEGPKSQKRRKRKEIIIVKTYAIHLLETYVTILFNWLIF